MNKTYNMEAIKNGTTMALRAYRTYHLLNILDISRYLGIDEGEYRTMEQEIMPELWVLIVLSLLYECTIDDLIYNNNPNFLDTRDDAERIIRVQKRIRGEEEVTIPDSSFYNLQATVIRNIIKLRDQKRFTFEYMEERLGLNYGEYAEIENFLVFPELKTLNNIALQLGVTIKNLFD